VNRDLIDKYQTTLDTTPQQGNPITDWLAQLPFFIDGDEAQPHCICEKIRFIVSRRSATKDLKIRRACNLGILRRLRGSGRRSFLWGIRASLRNPHREDGDPHSWFKIQKPR
jgi:hypothetical protein